MEQTPATKTYSGWLKPSLLALLIGGVTTAATLLASITQASNAFPQIMKVFNIPSCRAADVYRGTQSDFKREGDVWREYRPDAVVLYEFKEIKRTRDEIILRNLTPRETTDWSSLVVHLPACDGTARLSEGRPERWTDLEQVWRARRES